MTSSTPGQLQMDLVVVPEAVSAVRSVVRAHLRLWGHAGLIDRATLAVSELLTNVWKHAEPSAGTSATSARLTITRMPGGLFLCVRDPDPTPPQSPPAPGVEAVRGRGLHLVMSVADSFGVSPASMGKDVWLTLLPSGDPEPTAEHEGDERCSA